MKNNAFYDYDTICLVLDEFLKALKDNVIIYEGDLILYYNSLGVPSTFFNTVRIKMEHGMYSEEEYFEIVEKMNLIGMALNSNLIQAGMEARNPTWYIYVSKVKFGYVEGNADTKDIFTVTEGSKKSAVEIIQEAQEVESRLLNQ